MAPQTVQILDLRRPGCPMGSTAVKLPADCLAALQSEADKLNTTRAALLRLFVVQGLERLEAAAAGEMA